MPVRVLYLIGTLELGGAERQLTQLALGLDRSRFDPVVCCLFATGPLAKGLEASGVRVLDLGIRGTRLRRRPWMMIVHPLRLIKAVREISPDVVHGYLYWAYIGGAFAGRAARVPVVVAGRRSLGNFKEGKPVLLAIERVANWLTDLVIANSEAVRADALRQERLPPDKVIVIHNGIDAAKYRLEPDMGLKAQLGIEPGSPVVTVVANFIPYKGHVHFLEAWPKVLRAEPKAVALLVGDGPVRADLETQVRGLGIEQSVRFLGQRMDVPRILSISDLLAHPSLEEGFCNAILEAMAAGKPVVATSVGGNPEAVVDGRTGVLVPPSDPAALANALVGLLTNPAKARQMGREGTSRLEEEFDVGLMVGKYERVYLDLLGRQGAVPVRKAT